MKGALDAGPQGLDAVSEHWTDDIDHRAIEGAIDDRGPLHGKDAVRSYLQDWLVERLSLEAESVRAIGHTGVAHALEAVGLRE